jgi:hypothetical protein
MQDLTFAKQALCHLSYTRSPLGFFEFAFRQAFPLLAKLSSELDPSSFTSQVAKITGMHHHTQFKA